MLLGKHEFTESEQGSRYLKTLSSRKASITSTVYLNAMTGVMVR